MDSVSTSISPAAIASSPARPVSSRTQVLLTAPIVPTLLRVSAPNVLNLLAIVGMITFDGIFIGRLGPDALAGVSSPDTTVTQNRNRPGCRLVPSPDK